MNTIQEEKYEELHNNEGECDLDEQNFRNLRNLRDLMKFMNIDDEEI